MRKKTANRARGTKRFSKNEVTQHSPYLGGLITLVVISFVLAVLFFIIWVIFKSTISIILFLFLSIISATLLWFMLEGLSIQICGDEITFTYRIGTSFILYISRDLHQIVWKNGNVARFRFRSGRKRVQISPPAYTDGDILSAKIMDAFKKKKMIIRLINR